MGPMAEYVEAIKSPDVMAAPTMKNKKKKKIMRVILIMSIGIW